MKKIRKLLTLVLAIAMILSLGSSALASNDDWADYQQYVYSFAAAGAPTPAITELCTTQGAQLLSLDADHIAALQGISAAYAETTIPAGTYDGIDADVTTVGMKATIVANDTVTEDEAYTIVKTIFEGKDEITAGHAEGAELDLEFASSCGIPYNAGAAKYFAEQNIEVETAE